MKKLWIAFLACISFVCIAFCVACSGGDKKELAFNEGYLEEIILGDPIMLDEYIDPSNTDRYARRVYRSVFDGRLYGDLDLR